MTEEPALKRHPDPQPESDDFAHSDDDCARLIEDMEDSYWPEADNGLWTDFGDGNRMKRRPRYE